MAIVGRPNVGKSTLFNRLLGQRTAIVHDQPGVTRDRHYADVNVFGRTFTLIDTGGFDPEDSDAIGQGIARHVRAAVEEADLVLCVLDGQAPPSEADAAAVRMLRQSSKPVIYLANRLDHARLEQEATELYALGIQPIAISALHGRGMADLGQALTAQLPPPDLEGNAEGEEQAVPRVALVGRPNAGKSSLLNRLSGQERSLVDDRPGTTRDPVDVRLEFKGQPYLVVDTAGIRRRARVEDGVEAQSVMQALRAVARADVVVLLCDASIGLAEQDARLLGLCVDRARAIVVGLNKIDLLDAPARQRALESARSQLHFAPWVPIVPASNRSGEGITQLMNTVRRSFQEYSTRIPTAQLNQFLETLVEHTPPPRGSRSVPRLFFMTQAQASPPVFVVMCSAAEELKDSYRRFLTNQLRKTFGFESVPLVVRYRNRRRRD
ncbi:MAG TPA: ribosome biogenesis GTPase Der [Polyangiaceae bacterium]|nr:ribosome biogenesis GTPase Der [Polyangiaceae bacterium]